MYTRIFINLPMIKCVLIMMDKKNQVKFHLLKISIMLNSSMC
jgi:hypothetical protein